MNSFLVRWNSYLWFLVRNGWVFRGFLPEYFRTKPVWGSIKVLFPYSVILPLGYYFVGLTIGRNWQIRFRLRHLIFMLFIIFDTSIVQMQMKSRYMLIKKRWNRYILQRLFAPFYFIICFEILKKYYEFTIGTFALNWHKMYW